MKTEEQNNYSRKIDYQAWMRSGLFFIVILSVFSSGCGVTLSPVKRKPLEIYPLATSLAPSTQPILVHFESTLSGIPLSETVWDNASGAFADIKESHQIGFTQNYTKLLYPPALGATLKPDYTRIVIPFGRIFEGVFQSGLQKVFSNSSVNLDESNEPEKSQTTTSKYMVSLKIVEFHVWEDPLNHLNLKTVIECKWSQPSETGQPEHVYMTTREITNQPIGSAMSTSSGFINEMDKVSNQFAASVSEELLKNLQEKLGH
jgi:hypothetical protein